MINHLQWKFIRGCDALEAKVDDNLYYRIWANGDGGKLAKYEGNVIKTIAGGKIPALMVLAKCESDAGPIPEGANV